MIHPAEVNGMTPRRLLLVAACAAAVSAAGGPARAAHFATTNFTVTAPSEELARKFGEMAEFYRKEKALAWLGREMPPWPRPCPLEVRVTNAGAGGETSFTFVGDGTRGAVGSQKMLVYGPVKQLLNSVLPHEVTHTVLAHHFGRAVPRWADEGGSVLSENAEERARHDLSCREYLNAGKGHQLQSLFRMADYPRDMHVLYAQGYSVSQYLVDRGGGDHPGRAKLLRFLAVGMQGTTDYRFHGTPASWDAAARQVYGFDGVADLEARWLAHLRNPEPRVAARAEVAAGSAGAGYATTAAGRPEVRSSAAPGVPLLGPPVAVRGQMPDAEPPARPGAKPAAKRLAPAQPPPLLLPPTIPAPARP